MTTEELNTIVQAVVEKINGQVIDFDVVSSAPESTDLLSAVRSQNDGTYQGVTLKWDDVTNAVTREAKGYRDEAASAKTNVENMKASVDQTVSDFNTLAEQKKAEVQGVYQTDLNELKGDLDTERNARIEADTEHSTRLQKNRYEIDNLKAKAEGKLYRTETVEAEAYDLDIPSSVAPYAEVQRIGGKSVVWNQLVDPISTTINGVTVTASNGTWTLSGTSTGSGGRLTSVSSSFINLTSGHKYAIMLLKDVSIDIVLTDNNSKNVVTFISSSTIFTPDSSYETILGFNMSKDATYSGTIKLHIFDLTQMFGSKNEPTLEECKKIFSAVYYPYDAGTIRSFHVKTVKSEGKNKARINVFSNELTDTRAFFQPQVLTWNEGKVIGNYGETSSSVTGKYTIPFTTPSVFDEVQFRHNGESENIYIERFNTILMKPNTNYVLSMYIESSNPKTKGGIKVRDIQLEEGSTETAYTPYRKPVVLDVSSITSDFKSAGSVHDEWNNGKVTKRIGMYIIDGVDIKMDGLFQSNDYGNVFYLSSKLHNKFSNAISDKFIRTLDSADKMGLYSFVGSSGVPATICFVLPSTITTLIQANEWFNSNPTTVYYELATPTEETVPEISNYIQVEGGGTLTFESDDTVHMPVPSTDRFVVDLS